jgi:ABC-type multidrug transport system fused ATPase/permease subunit
MNLLNSRYVLAGKTPSYLNWSIVRAPGYPLFLSIVRAVDPELAHLPYVQMALLIASAAFLAQAAARLGGPWWIWLLMGAGILGNPFIWRYSWEVLTESLFITLVMFFLGCIAVALRARPARLRWLFGASVALGAAILVRPVGYALVGVAPVIGLLWHGRRWAAVCAATLPAIAMLLAVSSWNFVNKGYFGTQIFAGYNIGRYDHTLPITSTADPTTLQNPSSVAVAKHNHAYSLSIAVATIRHHPADYIDRVLTNFADLWRFPDISSAEAARIKIPGFAVPLKDGLFLALMALSFILVIAVAIAPAASQLLVFTAGAALCVNANHLLVALLEDHLPRYAMAMWPGLLAMVAAFAAWLSVRRDGKPRQPH